jgi:BolA protein
MTSARGQRIEARLRERLAPVHVEVIDESHLHAGHVGDRGGETHYRATIGSPRFTGLSRVDAQRLVYDAVADELAAGLHALALCTLTPEQWLARGKRSAQ